ncbi:MAG: hypothetical protein GEU28_08700 [Dehalococcoidia bacterium]|nr:hypothetical protein [Dehalococcoidia bacterium]
MSLSAGYWRSLALIGFAIGAPAAAGYAGFLAFQQVTSGDTTWSWPPLAVAVAACVAQVVVLAGAWGCCLRAVRPPLDLRRAAVIHSFSLGWLARYLPLPSISPAGKLVVGLRAGYPPALVTAALVYQQVTQFLGVLLVPGFVLAAVLGLERLWLLPVIAAAITGGVAATVSLTSSGLLQRAALSLKIGGAHDLGRVTPPALFPPTILYVAGSLLACLSFHSVAVAVSSWPADAVGRSVFIFSTASAIGYLVPFLPSGAGVREGVILALLGPEIGTSAALTVAISARAVAVLVDSGLGALLGLHYVLAALRSRLRASRLPANVANRSA